MLLDQLVALFVPFRSSEECGAVSSYTSISNYFIDAKFYKNNKYRKIVLLDKKIRIFKLTLLLLLSFLYYSFNIFSLFVIVYSQVFLSFTTVLLLLLLLSSSFCDYFSSCYSPSSFLLHLLLFVIIIIIIITVFVAPLNCC